MRHLLLTLGLVLIASSVWAQVQLPPIATAAADPTTCSTNPGIGELAIYYNTASALFKYCSAPNVWAAFVTGGSSPTFATINATTGYQVNGLAPVGDVLCGNGTVGVWCDPGTLVTRTDATASVTLNCPLTNDGSNVVALTNAGAIAVTGCTPGVNFPNGRTVFVDVQGAAAIATLTPAAGNCNGAATCAMAQGFWRVRSDGSQTFASIEPRTAAGGGVTSVTATTPLASSGGATPNLSVVNAPGGLVRRPSVRVWSYTGGSGASTTISSIGPDTSAGTGTAATTNCTGSGTVQGCVQYTSATTANSQAGWVSNTSALQGYAKYGRNVYFAAEGYVADSVNTGNYYWVGLTSSLSTANFGNGVLTHCVPAVTSFAGFCYLVGTDTNWRCVLDNAGTGTIADSTVAVNTTTAQIFEVWEDVTNSKFHFYIGGTEVCAAISQTNRPVSGTGASHLFLGNDAATGTAAVTRLMWLYKESDAF